MHPYLSEIIAHQRQADLCARAARSRRASQARYATQARYASRARYTPQARYASQARYAPQARQARARRGHRHLIRRRAGWALVSLGLRLAYVASED